MQINIIQVITIEMNPKMIKIGVQTFNPKKLNRFFNFVESFIYKRINVAKNIEMEIKTIEEESIFELDYLLYGFDIEQIDSIPDQIKKISSRKNNKNDHRFQDDCVIIFMIDGCDDVSLDDEDIVFNDTEIASKLSEINDIITFSSSHLLLLDRYQDEKTITNMSDREINLLSTMLKLKTMKMEKAEKYRLIEKKMKVTDLSSYMTMFGGDSIISDVLQHFKITQQKIKVTDNYLKSFASVILSSSNVDEIINLHREILELKLLKDDMAIVFNTEINNIMLKKIKFFINDNKNKIQFDSKVTNTLDPHQYFEILNKFAMINKEINSLVEPELESVNKQIVVHYNNKMKEITQLSKICDLLEINSKNKSIDISNLMLEILSNTKIYEANISNTKGWNDLVDKLFQLKITERNILQIVEKIVKGKINYYCTMDSVKLNPNKTYHYIYPQCLSMFLSEHLNNGFIFKKLYIYLTQAIKYTARGLDDFINNLTEEQYNELVEFEHRIIELNNNQINVFDQDESSDSDMDNSNDKNSNKEKVRKN